MEEVAFQFAWMFYGALARGGAGLRRLAGLYAPTSRLACDGAAEAAGREAIVERLAAAAAAAAARVGGAATWRIRTVDAQPLGSDGAMLVHATGSVVLAAGEDGSGGGGNGGGTNGGDGASSSSGGGGGGFGGGGSSDTAAGLGPDLYGGSGGGGGVGFSGGSGGDNTAPRWLFADTFVLQRSPTGEYFVPNQATRMLPAL